MEQYGDKKLYLSDLQHGPIYDGVCVKVMRKWLYDGTQRGNNVIYIGLVLADEKGDFIYGHIPGKHIHAKGSLVELDEIYIIRKFNMKSSKTTYVPFVKELMVEFGGYTMVIAVANPPTTFPRYVYNLTPYSELNAIYPQSTVYVDVLGIIVSVDNIVQQRLSSLEKMVPMRELVIKNLRDEELKVTLWDNHAKEFSLPGTSSSRGFESIVVLFVGCVPKIMNHKTQVNGSYGCRWFFNPDIQEAEPYYQSLRKTPVPVFQPPPQDPIDAEALSVPPIQQKSLYDLNNEDPYELSRHKQGYKCTVTVTDIPEQKYWYVGCAKCNKASKDDSSTFWCKPCQCSETKTLYKLSFVAEDETDQGRFFAYNIAARNIIRREVRAVLNQQAREPGFPKFLKEAISRKFTFHVVLREDSYDGPDTRNHLVRAVLIDHDMQGLKIRNQAEKKVTDTGLTKLPGSMLTDRSSAALPSPITTTLAITTNQQETPPPPHEFEETPNSAQLNSQKEHPSKCKATAQKALFQDSPSQDKIRGDNTEEVATENLTEKVIESADHTTVSDPPKETRSKRGGDDESAAQTKNKLRKTSGSKSNK